MMGKTLAPITIATAVLVLLAVPAAAAHRHRDTRAAQVLALAERVERAAYELYCDAVAEGRARTRGEHRALGVLRDVERRARDFAHRVARSGLDHRRTEREFRRLERSVQVAEQRLHDLRGRRLRRNFAEVERLVNRLDHRLAFDHGRRRGRDDRGRDRYASAGLRGWTWALGR